MTDLGTFGGQTSGAAGINASGQVVGSAQTASGLNHAFLESAGQMLDLGSLGNASFGFAINASGQVAGLAYVPNPDGTVSNRAVLSTGGGPVVDLNTLISGLPSGWVLTTATGIADNGTIVGFATVDGKPHGYLLTPNPAPVPEPTTLAVFALASAALASATWSGSPAGLTRKSASGRGCGA